jgi:uncharacterized protein YkwD
VNLALSIAIYAFAQSGSAPAVSKEQRMIAQVITLTNRERSKDGLTALVQNANLSKAAAYLASDLAERQELEHMDRRGRRLVERVEADGYTTWTSVAENIAYGQETAARVVDAWMKSPGHRENLMGRSYSEIGVGLAFAKNGTPYWVQIFGSR